MKMWQLIILAMNLGTLLPVNLINFTILTQGKILLVEPVLAIIVVECVVWVVLTVVTAGWLIKELKNLGYSLGE